MDVLPDNPRDCPGVFFLFEKRSAGDGLEHFLPCLSTVVPRSMDDAYVRLVLSQVPC
jgi:hypothetical protein